MTRVLQSIQGLLDILGGVRPLPDRLASHSLFLIVWGVWWLVLLLIVVASSGQSVKFVYVDF